MNRYFLMVFFSLVTCCAGQNLQKDPKPPCGFWNNTLIKFYLVLGLVDLVDLSPEIPPDIEVFADIVFKETEQRPLKLDIYRKKKYPSACPGNYLYPWRQLENRKQKGLSNLSASFCGKRIYHCFSFLSIFAGGYFPCCG